MGSLEIQAIICLKDEAMVLKKHNKSAYKRLIVGIGLLLIYGIISYNVDKVRINNGLESIFAFPITFFKDGGSTYRIGIGYGVMEWRKIAVVNKDGKSMNGEYYGNELIVFPRCYMIIGNHDISPGINLEFHEYKN